jgi:serine/threonine protein kinase
MSIPSNIPNYWRAHIKQAHKGSDQLKISIDLSSHKALSFTAHIQNPSQESFFGWIKTKLGVYTQLPLMDTSGKKTAVWVNTHKITTQLVGIGFNEDEAHKLLKNTILLGYDGAKTLSKTDRVAQSAFPRSIDPSSSPVEDFIEINSGSPIPDPHSLNTTPELVESLNLSPEAQAVLLHHLGIDEGQKLIDKVSAIFSRHQDAFTFYFSSSSIPYNFGEVTVVSPNQAFIEIPKEIGKGSYKTQKLTVDIAGNVFASYRLSKSEIGPLTYFEHEAFMEVEALKAQQEKPNILSLAHKVENFATEEVGTMQTLVCTHYYNQGSLSEIMRKNTLTPDQVISVEKQLAAGLNALHKDNKAHRDLKPANIFIKDNPQLQGALELVIGDLGSLTDMKDAEKLKHHFTTLWYASPEYLKARCKEIYAESALKDVYRFKTQLEICNQELIHTAAYRATLIQRLKANQTQLTEDIRRAKSRTKELLKEYSITMQKANKLPLDVWSLGVIYYELACENLPPWLPMESGDTEEDLLYHIEEAYSKGPLPIPNPEDKPPIPQAMKKLIQDMLSFSDDKRPTIAEVFERLSKIYPS